MMEQQRSQPPMGAAAPDDIANYLSGTAFGQLAKMLKTGWNYAGRFAKSLATGPYDPFANQPGAITATGASAGLFAYDRAGAPGNYVAVYRDGTNFYLQAAEGATIGWNATTGAATQPAWIAAPALLNSYTAGTAVQYRKEAGGGAVVWRGSLNMVAASVNAVVFTIPTGYRPSYTGVASQYFPVPVLVSGVWQGALALIDSSGNLSIQCPAGTTYAGLDGLRYPTV